jgi:hypothetical protein
MAGENDLLIFDEVELNFLCRPEAFVWILWCCFIFKLGMFEKCDFLSSFEVLFRFYAVFLLFLFLLKKMMNFINDTNFAKFTVRVFNLFLRIELSEIPEVSMLLKDIGVAHALEIFILMFSSLLDIFLQLLSFFWFLISFGF